tara:strand:- start:3092 stop:3313 length:222 start_codon:yes stop_codon:yes gene_type:complete
VTKDWDIDWEYWDAQVEGYKQSLRKPIWRDYLQTQKEKMDKVYDFFWDRTVNGGESTRREEELNEVLARHVGK